MMHATEIATSSSSEMAGSWKDPMDSLVLPHTSSLLCVEEMMMCERLMYLYEFLCAKTFEPLLLSLKHSDRSALCLRRHAPISLEFLRGEPQEREYSLQQAQRFGQLHFFGAFAAPQHTLLKSSCDRSRWIVMMRRGFGGQ